MYRSDSFGAIATRGDQGRRGLAWRRLWTIDSSRVFLARATMHQGCKPCADGVPWQRACNDHMHVHAHLRMLLRTHACTHTRMYVHAWTPRNARAKVLWTPRNARARQCTHACMRTRLHASESLNQTKVRSTIPAALARPPV